MDRGSDPYTPDAGAPPRFPVGRRTEVDDFRVLLQRLARGYTEQSLVITGLRGVGKTVLLGQYRRITEESRGCRSMPRSRRTRRPAPRWPTSRAEPASPCRRGPDGGSRATGAAGVLESLSPTVHADGTLTAGLDVDPQWGRADTGHLGEDLADVFAAMGEAAVEQDTGIVFLFDEVQFDEVQFLSKADWKPSGRSTAPFSVSCPSPSQGQDSPSSPGGR
ncbi:ATP-binding protein [Geodermatophilus sp. SYSU D00758]